MPASQLAITDDETSNYQQRSYFSQTLSGLDHDAHFHARARGGVNASRPSQLKRFRRVDVGGVRLACFAGLAGCLLFAVLSGFGQRSREVGSVWPTVERVASMVGLGVDQVILAGHHYTPERDIFDALRLNEQRSFLSFDDEATLRRVKDLSWVKSASVVRIFPGQLKVSIVERDAFALWQRGSEYLLIDRTGRVLSATEKRLAPNLPFVSGHGAGEEVGPLMRLVSAAPAISGRLVEAVRVSKRRWTLRLSRDVKVHLPAEGAAFALSTLRTHPRLEKLLARPHTILDFRVSGRVGVRSSNGNFKPVLITRPGAVSIENGRRG